MDIQCQLLQDDMEYCPMNTANHLSGRFGQNKLLFLDSAFTAS